uniref:T-cell receptor alpha/delta variable 5.0.1 n=1 Tax=Sinocyclocheilus anshuiensis TaxID=1608454 RepID=A0A671Q1Q1_9TELE
MFNFITFTYIYLITILNLVCLFSDSLGNLIKSHGSEKQAQDGSSVTLYCNYTGVVFNLLWYRQYQRSKPELLLSMTESGDPVKADPSAHWLSAKVDKHRKLMELEISPAKVSDSAQYYCALVPTVTGNLFPLHKIFLHISHASHSLMSNKHMYSTLCIISVTASAISNSIS